MAADQWKQRMGKKDENFINVLGKWNNIETEVYVVCDGKKRVKKEEIRGIRG